MSAKSSKDCDYAICIPGAITIDVPIIIVCEKQYFASVQIMHKQPYDSYLPLVSAIVAFWVWGRSPSGPFLGETLGQGPTFRGQTLSSQGQGRWSSMTKLTTGKCSPKKKSLLTK